MSLLETFLQDLRFGVRTLRRDLGFSAVSILALALGIGVNTVVFTAYKAFVARPLDARDPDTLVNISLHLQSGATTARFSYPDYEGYRDGLRSFSGVIAFSIEELRLTDAGGIVMRRSEESLIGRLGLASPSASNAEMVSNLSSFRRTTSRCSAWLRSVGVRSTPSTHPNSPRRHPVSDRSELLAPALRGRPRGIGEEHSPQRRRLHHRRGHAGQLHGHEHRSAQLLAAARPLSRRASRQQPAA